MGNIVLLDDLTINKIAAGEVVERPASVVKEMVENSIDAGATKVTVEIKNGGISFIRISDNGKGIAEDDMEIAFERHATSKIRVADDITKVTSMGFRGEALASIAAIANVEMISRTANSSIGRRIVVEGGKVLETGEVGAPIGTTITVKNLFYNTPVRYKFLKKDYTESGYIEDAISRLALVNKNIAFKLINTGKTVIQTTGNDDEKSVIYSIYGKDISENVIDIEYEYEGIKVSGVVGKPEIARSNRSNQLFFVNGRYVKDRTLTAAAEQALKNIIPANKYGFLVLNIEMNPADVDVNVHPAKLEVRFEDENKVFKAVYGTIKQALTVQEEKEIENQTQNNELINQEKEAQNHVTDNIEQKSDEVAKAIREDELFGKRNRTSFFKKNKDEYAKPEENDNLLEEVYKFRKGLKEIGVSEVPTSVYAPIFDEEMFKDEEQAQTEETEKNTDVIEPIEDIEENKIESAVEKNEIIVPSEEKVQEMTEELIKQRESTEILEEAIQNSKLENHLENDDDSENNQKFDDMYAKIFGDKPPVRQDNYEKVLSENEQKMLDEIKSSIKSVAEEQPIEEKSTEEEKNVEIDDSKSEDSETNVANDSANEDISDNNEQEVLIDDATFAQDEQLKNVMKQNYKYVGVAFSNYIIVEIEDEMCIIDWKNANERIVYEKIKKDYLSEKKDSQTMLMADIINLNHRQVELLKENLELFEKAGFGLEAFGENTIKLTDVPNMCINMNTKHLFLELLDGIDEYPKNSNQSKDSRFMHELAKKIVIAKDTKINEREVNYLIGELLEFENPYEDNDGNKVAMEVTKGDIERKFNRR